MLPQKLVFVDTETTGLSVSRDRIIEIGIVRVENGKVVAEYESLINPERFLSPFISSITQITEQDIEHAPTFYDIRKDIYDLLQDAVFVAHNVRFDYGFLRNEFKRVEMDFTARHFCTAKLSRALFPQHRHHNLDSIIERFDLVCERRHRAFDDAKILWDFYQTIQKQVAEDRLGKYITRGLKHPSLPIKLTEEQLHGLPESPGVYIFYGENRVPLYVGKSINVKERVLSHFSSDYTIAKEMHLSQQVEDIVVISTAGELGALLKEAQLIKQLQPLYNRKLRNSRRLIVMKKRMNANGYQEHYIEELITISPDETADIVGVFRSKKQAKEFLYTLVKEHALCEKLVGLEKTRSGCFAYRLGTCKGACVGKENPLLYNARCIIAFSKNSIKPWPFSGPILITEKGGLVGHEDAFYVDKWCLLGKQSLKDNQADFFTSEDYRFDMDTYKILSKYLGKASSSQITLLKDGSFASMSS